MADIECDHCTSDAWRGFCRIHDAEREAELAALVARVGALEFEHGEAMDIARRVTAGEFAAIDRAKVAERERDAALYEVKTVRLAIGEAGVGRCIADWLGLLARAEKAERERDETLVESAAHNAAATQYEADIKTLRAERDARPEVSPEQAGIWASALRTGTPDEIKAILPALYSTLSAHAAKATKTNGGADV